MPSPALVASDVMDLSASLLNDTAKSSFTYAAQLPYLKSAYDELGQILESNNISMTTELSSILVITTAMTDIGGSTGPALPADLIEIQTLYERLSGSAEDFIEMTETTYLPTTVVLVEALIYWTWQKQVIQFMGATTTRDVKIEYIGNTLGAIVDQTTVINYYNAKNFLAFRTASLCANFIGENPSRAKELQDEAIMAKDTMIGINIKGNQSIPVRRRPFMSRFKMRGF